MSRKSKVEVVKVVKVLKNNIHTVDSLVSYVNISFTFQNFEK